MWREADRKITTGKLKTEKWEAGGLVFRERARLTGVWRFEDNAKDSFGAALYDDGDSDRPSNDGNAHGRDRGLAVFVAVCSNCGCGSVDVYPATERTAGFDGSRPGTSCELRPGCHQEWELALS